MLPYLIVRGNLETCHILNFWNTVFVTVFNSSGWRWNRYNVLEPQEQHSLSYKNIRIKPVNYVIACVSSVLKHVFNLAQVSAIFPEEIKKGRVSIIHKGGAWKTTEQYLSSQFFSKGLEKIISNWITHYFSSKLILSDSQLGFRKGRSTETTLLTIEEIIVQNIDNRLYTLGLFIDFSKVFDSFSHDIFADKLFA